MSPKQAATLTEALSGRIPVLLLVLEDGSVCVIVGDRARAERVAAERRAVVVEMGPVAGARSGANCGPPMAENARCGSHLPG
jgi:hypothetical protein